MPAALRPRQLPDRDRSLVGSDPVLPLVQRAMEPADPQVYARLSTRDPKGPRRQVLMMQGIVDHYILPPIANSLSLAFGLDVGDPALDVASAELRDLTPLQEFLDLAGQEMTSSSSITVVTQHAADGIEDGHEVAFQTAAPKAEMRSFLKGLAVGQPVVDAACAGVPRSDPWASSSSSPAWLLVAALPRFSMWPSTSDPWLALSCSSPRRETRSLSSPTPSAAASPITGSSARALPHHPQERVADPRRHRRAAEEPAGAQALPRSQRELVERRAHRRRRRLRRRRSLDRQRHHRRPPTLLSAEPATQSPCVGRRGRV